MQGWWPSTAPEDWHGKWKSWVFTRNLLFQWLIFRFHPTGSMHGISTYIYHKNHPNVGKYTIRGSSGHVKIPGVVWCHGTSGGCFPTVSILSGQLVNYSRPLPRPCSFYALKPGRRKMLEDLRDFPRWFSQIYAEIFHKSIGFNDFLLWFSKKIMGDVRIFSLLDSSEIFLWL